MILYEYPFNERIRTYLRLEHMFRRLDELVKRPHALDHHYALITMFEVMDIGSRADLKSEVLKDLDRQRSLLEGYRDNPAIAEDVLDRIINRVNACFQSLNAQPGKIGQALTENDWLMGIRSRTGIPGGTCEFDLPAYYAWQNKPDTDRRADLDSWRASFVPLSESIRLLLGLLRDSGSAQKVMATGGQFQQNLPQGRTFQLLRMAIDPGLGVVPEISGNRLIVSIRMMKQGPDSKLSLWPENIGFELALCA